MIAVLRSKPHFILAYNGCDRETGEEALRCDGPEGLVASDNGYDWLGTGVYFWETDPRRALQWAEIKHQDHVRREKEKGTPVALRRPFVVGAIVNLGMCLDLTTVEGVSLLKEGYGSYLDDFKKLQKKKPELTLPQNDEKTGKMYLDYQVINHTCRSYEEEMDQSIDTVRALIPEGDFVYPGGSFKDKTHTQICVRKQRAIIAYFRMRDMGLGS